MGVTLAELLDNSGITSLSGEQEKTASINAPAQDKGNLVSALRKLAESEEKPDEGNIKHAAARELAEKTAEIMVISQTISEIEKVASLGIDDKTQQKLATFIKVALDKGHSEEEIAEFVKSAFEPVTMGLGALGAAGLGALGLGARAAVRRAGGADAIIQSIKRPFGRMAKNVARTVNESEMRLLRKKMVHGSGDEIAQHLKMLEGERGRPALVEALKAIEQEGTPLHFHAKKYLPYAERGGPVKPGLKIKLPGSEKETEIPASTLKGVGMGGVGLGTGLALSRRNSGGNKGRGVTVVNS